jgi:hypothetical protein
VIARTVTVSRRTPAQTPTPRHTLPPATPAPHATLAPRIVVRAPAPRAAAVPHRRSGGAAARRHVAVVRRPLRPAPPPALADSSHAGVQNGGAGTGAGAGTGDSGQGGRGTGTAGTGSGNGGDANTAPCGDIYILPGALAYEKDGTVVQHVLAKIVERDGTVEVDKFPYPFRYPAERNNPFSHDDQLAANGGIPVQQPPPGSDVSTMPLAVQIVLRYTDPTTGFTTLPACTPSSPAP